MAPLCNPGPLDGVALPLNEPILAAIRRYLSRVRGAGKASGAVNG